MCLNHKTKYFCGHERQLDTMFYKCQLRPGATLSHCDCPDKTTHYLKADNVCPDCCEQYKGLVLRRVVPPGMEERENFQIYLKHLQLNIDVLALTHDLETERLEQKVALLEGNVVAEMAYRQHLSETLMSIIHGGDGDDEPAEEITNKQLDDEGAEEEELHGGASHISRHE